MNEEPKPDDEPVEEPDAGAPETDDEHENGRARRGGVDGSGELGGGVGGAGGPLRVI